MDASAKTLHASALTHLMPDVEHAIAPLDIPPRLHVEDEGGMRHLESERRLLRIRSAQIGPTEYFAHLPHPE